MKSKFIRVICAPLLIVSICLAGCSGAKETIETVTPMEKEESHAVSFNFLGGKDVMPICIFDGPYVSGFNQDGNLGPDFVTDEYFQLLKGLGINLITESKLDWLTSKADLIRSLQLGEKYGIGLYIGDRNLTWNHDITAEQAAGYVSEYYGYPAFCGLTLLDEPNTPTYNRDGNEARDLDKFINLAKILQYDLDMYCYINMYACADWDAKGREVYTNYMKEVSEALKPRIYSYDMYPFDDKNQGLWDKYLWNLSICRETALKNNAPFWGYIAAGAQWTEHYKSATTRPYYPNEPQFYWHVNTTLAMGAQGMQYYMCFPGLTSSTVVTTDWDYNEHGIFGELGNKNQWYYYVENVNKQIAAIDDVLMNSVSKGIIASGKQTKNDAKYVSCLIESGQFQELQSVTGDALVGCFNYNGKTALYVVNYSMEYAQHIKLNFNGNHKIKVVQNAETSYVKANSLTLDMAAGEGVLLVIQ